jgi:hypothetical protein
MDFNTWFGGANQGLHRENGLSKRADADTARSAVMALSGLEGKGTLRRGRVAERLAELKKRKEEAKKNTMQVPLSKAIAHMTSGQVDAVVRQFVFGPSGGDKHVGSNGKAGQGEGEGAPQQQASGQTGSRRLLMWQDTEIQGMTASTDDLLQAPPQAREELEATSLSQQALASKKSYGKIQDVVLGKKSPLCLYTRKFEKGITCRAPGVPAPPGYAPTPAPGKSTSSSTTVIEAPPPDTYVPPPPSVVQAPVICPSYIAPDHGSVWVRGKKHRISTMSGTRVGGQVKVTCHRHYR